MYSMRAGGVKNEENVQKKWSYDFFFLSVIQKWRIWGVNLSIFEHTKSSQNSRIWFILSVPEQKKMIIKILF